MKSRKELVEMCVSTLEEAYMLGLNNLSYFELGVAAVGLSSAMPVQCAVYFDYEGGGRFDTEAKLDLGQPFRAVRNDLLTLGNERARLYGLTTKVVTARVVIVGNVIPPTWFRKMLGCFHWR